MPTTDLPEISFSVIFSANKPFKWALSYSASEYISCFPYPVHIMNQSYITILQWQAAYINHEVSLCAIFGSLNLFDPS